MPYDSEGNFTRVHNWEDDRINGISIDSLRMDEDLDDIANGLSQAFLKNGNSAMERDLDMNGFKVRNVADGTAQADAVNLGQLNNLKNYIEEKITTSLSSTLEKIYPKNSIYASTVSTNPSSYLGFGTWEQISSKIITDLSSSAPVKGNGKALGLTNNSSGNTIGYLSGNDSGSGHGYSVTTSSSNVLGNTEGRTPQYNGIGITTNESQSGIVANVSSGSTSVTVYLFKRTA